jgi:phosphoribosyl 1,2-cyclic phosphate phosphodiesterase
MVNDDLLIDIGPDFAASMHKTGANFGRVSTLLVTHAHGDHLFLPNLYMRRSHFCATTPAQMEVFGTSPTTSAAKAEAATRNLTEDEFYLRLNTINPGDSWQTGRYRVTAFPAAHAEELDPVFYAIEEGGRTLLYASDTGPFPDETWRLLQDFQFDCAIIESTLGIGPPGAQHLSMEQCAEHHQRLESEGLLKPGARRFATHFSHNRTPPYLECVEFFAPHSVEPAYDGLTVQV